MAHATAAAKASLESFICYSLPQNVWVVLQGIILSADPSDVCLSPGHAGPASRSPSLEAKSSALLWPKGRHNDGFRLSGSTPSHHQWVSGNSAAFLGELGP